MNDSTGMKKKLIRIDKFIQLKRNQRKDTPKLNEM